MNIDQVTHIDPVLVSDETVSRQLQKAEISQETLLKFERARNPKIKFRYRLKNFLQAENDLGKAARIVKHGIMLLTPFGSQIEDITQFGKQVLLPESNQTERNSMYWLINRLKEKSTWRGITAALTAVGLALSPDQAAVIVSLGVAIASTFEIFFKEPQSKDAS